jgi:hypothetical protein
MILTPKKNKSESDPFLQLNSGSPRGLPDPCAITTGRTRGLAEASTDDARPRRTFELADRQFSSSQNEHLIFCRRRASSLSVAPLMEFCGHGRGALRRSPGPLPAGIYRPPGEGGLNLYSFPACTTGRGIAQLCAG